MCLNLETYEANAYVWATGTHYLQTFWKIYKYGTEEAYFVRGSKLQDQMNMYCLSLIEPSRSYCKSVQVLQFACVDSTY